MSSKKETLDYVLSQLARIEDISSRKMMGEYLIYYHGKVVAGIYDDRFLVKKTNGSAALLPHSNEQLPYDGAKPMLSMSDIIFDERPDNAALIEKVFNAIYKDLS
jgi:TfoX/Sxy family transcriptional regulator of competence genes